MIPRYRIELTATAEENYRRFYEQAQASLESGDTSNPKVTNFKVLEQAIEETISSNPCDPERALSGTFSNIFRLTVGSIRIVWVADSENKKVFILFIHQSEKRNDPTDPYSIFTRLVLSGKFDDVFASLGIPPPNRTSPISPPSIQ